MLSLQKREEEYEAEQKRLKKEKEMDIARLKDMQEKERDIKAEQVRQGKMGDLPQAAFYFNLFWEFGRTRSVLGGTRRSQTDSGG